MLWSGVPPNPCVKHLFPRPAAARSGARNRTARSLLTFALAAVTFACSTVNPYYDPAVPHRARDGFHNNYPTGREGSYWTWQWERWREGLPKPPANGYRFPMATPETAWLRANRGQPASCTMYTCSPVLLFLSYLLHV